MDLGLKGKAVFITGATRTEAVRNTNPPSGIIDMIRDDLIAERIAVQSYSEVIRWLGNDDLTTCKVLRDILAVEEQQATDMKTLIARLLEGKKVT